MNPLKSIAKRMAPSAYQKLQEVRSRRLLRIVTSRILDRYGAVVQDGPFAGMIFVSQAANSSIVPKIVGSYESQLHDVIRSIVSNHYATIINIGCAEGYYAVGLARLFPSSSVHAFDLDPLARSLCGEMAQLNSVSVTIHGKCTAEALSNLPSRFDRCLIVCDCEGAELEILDPMKVANLLECDILLELHDFLNPIISGEMRSRFGATHEMTFINNEQRYPKDFPATNFLSDLEQRVALAEFRPDNMQWVFMVPNPAASTINKLR